MILLIKFCFRILYLYLIVSVLDSDSDLNIVGYRLNSLRDAALRIDSFCS